MAFDPTKDYITRKEKYLTVMAGNTDISYPEPITREEHYLAAMCDPDNNTAPDPITRREHYLSAIVQKISEGGGSSYTLLATKELTVNTTATSGTLVDTISLTPSDVWTTAQMIYVRIYDKAGPRDGYFYGTENICINTAAANGDTTGDLAFQIRGILRRSNAGKYEIGNGSGYGVYANKLSSAGDITIYSRYSSTSSLTINGTYTVEVYSLKYPDDDSPFA